MKVKVINKSANDLPFYATKGSVGMDVYSNEELELEPLSTTIVKTGLFVKIPEGYEIQVRPRSGLSAKSKLRIANSPGTIDSDYLEKRVLDKLNNDFEPVEGIIEEPEIKKSLPVQTLDEAFGEPEKLEE